MKVVTSRAELHKIQHKSTQVVAEGIRLENYLLRNVAALCNFQCNVCPRKLKHVGGGERRAELRRSARRQQFIIKVSPWQFYNRQEEVLNLKSPKVIDRFVFNYLAIDNMGQTADNKHNRQHDFSFLSSGE